MIKSIRYFTAKKAYYNEIGKTDSRFWKNLTEVQKKVGDETVAVAQMESGQVDDDNFRKMESDQVADDNF